MTNEPITNDSGLMVRVGEWVVGGSVAGQLEQLQQSLI
jgi:F0F1-type ATP synthase delta subunit